MASMSSGVPGKYSESKPQDAFAAAFLSSIAMLSSIAVAEADLALCDMGKDAAKCCLVCSKSFCSSIVLYTWF